MSVQRNAATTDGHVLHLPVSVQQNSATTDRKLTDFSCIVDATERYQTDRKWTDLFVSSKILPQRTE